LFDRLYDEVGDPFLYFASGDERSNRIRLLWGSFHPGTHYNYAVYSTGYASSTFSATLTPPNVSKGYGIRSQAVITYSFYGDGHHLFTSAPLGSGAPSISVELDISGFGKFRIETEVIVQSDYNSWAFSFDNDWRGIEMAVITVTG
jgi:hypothetical protein